MILITDRERTALASPGTYRYLQPGEERDVAVRVLGASRVVEVNAREFDVFSSICITGASTTDGALSTIAARVTAATGADAATVAKAVREALDGLRITAGKS